MSVREPITVSSNCRERAGTELAAGDVRLLLRAHAEHGWLVREVLPVVRQVEGRSELAPQHEYAALAYLEVVWEEALARARRTDECRELLAAPLEREQLCERACRYHARVRELRERLATRVSVLLSCAAVPR